MSHDIIQLGMACKVISIRRFDGVYNDAGLEAYTRETPFPFGGAQAQKKKYFSRREAELTAFAVTHRVYHRVE